MRTHRPRRRYWLAAGVLLAVLVPALAGAAPAFASAWWRVSSRPAPSVLNPGGKARITLAAVDVGDVGVNATSSPVTIKGVLPPGLEASEIRGYPAFDREAAHQMSCSLETLSCTTKPEVFAPFERLEVEIAVNVRAGASTGEINTMTVEGGQQAAGSEPPMPTDTQQTPLALANEPTQFGVEPDGYTLTPEDEGGSIDDQAGSHPLQLTTTLDLNQTLEPPNEAQSAPVLPKRLAFNLPPGLIGDPLATPQCSTADFDAYSPNGTNTCPAQDAIGVALVTIDEPIQFGVITRAVPLWNLEPEHGEPARFGFEIYDNPIVLDTSVRTNGDYGVTVTANNAPESAQLLGSEVTIWGVPGAASHNPSRGWQCLDAGIWSSGKPCQPEPQAAPQASFLTLPTACTSEDRTTVEGESWPLKTLASEPGQIFTLTGPSTETLLPPIEGCQHTPFAPTVTLHPETQATSTPTGLSVNIHLPQQGTLEPEGLATADVTTTTLTLPAGMQLNPSAANGLQACSEQQIGYEGKPDPDPYSLGAPQPLRFSSEAAHCPETSKLGLVRIATPVLAHELTGSLYLATQDANPFNSLLALYLVAEDPYSGIKVKLAGQAETNPETGQITTTFQNTPQVPFEELHLELFGGPRASLSTPALCGSYKANTSFTARSGALREPASEPPFALTSGPGGGPCPSNPLPFAPSFTAGVNDLQAGAFTPFTLTIGNPDGDQPLAALTMHLPAGVAAQLSNVTPCPEPQAARNQCGPESLIGQSLATSGLGPDPVQLPGQAYLTGPYEGAPFGLAVVTPAVAGPFDLGDVTVRSKIDVDPHTAQVTITSDPFPTHVEGIPVDLKQVAVNVNRPDFEYNPTSCNPMSIEGTLTGSQGANSSVRSPFQVANCQSLPFKPTVTATTRGQTSKANGASLTLKFASHTGEAHVAKTILTIPATLPARLTTIQKACIAGVFEANPASCPEGSDIGTAIVHTPVLKNPLTGPIYLVSHGNAAWPDAELVLQGEGVTVILDGQTAIRKGVTTSSFDSVPDAPFESVEATLPEGPHSALTTNLPFKDHYSLCGQSLTIPTALTGQNGTAVNESVRVTVQGCHAVKASKTRKLMRAQKLALALNACRTRYKRVHARRASCERTARKRNSPDISKSRRRGHKT